MTLNDTLSTWLMICNDSHYFKHINAEMERLRSYFLPAKLKSALYMFALSTSYYCLISVFYINKENKTFPNEEAYPFRISVENFSKSSMMC